MTTAAQLAEQEKRQADDDINVLEHGPTPTGLLFLNGDDPGDDPLFDPYTLEAEPNAG